MRAKSKARKRKSQSDLPRWALREISSLSNATGISLDKVIAMVAGFGIYQAKSELLPIGNLMEAAIAMATLPAQEDARPEEPELQAKTDYETPPSSGPLAGEVVIPGISDDLGNSNLEERTQYAGTGREGSREVEFGSGYLSAMSGE